MYKKYYPTLLTSFNDQPSWCRRIKSVKEYSGYHLGQLVLDFNKTLCRVVHISDNGFFRLSLINEKGLEYAQVTAILSSLYKYNWTLYK